MHPPPYLDVSSLLHVFRVEDALEEVTAWRRRRTTGDDDKNLGDTTSFYGRRVRQEQSAIYNDGTRARWQCDGDGDGVPVDGRVVERVVQ